MRSISNALLLRVLTIYLAVVALLLLGDMALEYRETRDNLATQLDGLQETFGGNIAFALWHLQDEPLDTTLQGMLSLPDIGRVTVRDTHDKILRDVVEPNLTESVAWLPETRFVSRKPIRYDKKEMGSLEIHTDPKVLLARLHVRVRNALAKVLVEAVLLGILVHLFFNRMLTQPLFGVARLAAAINPRKPGNAPLPVKSGVPDELDVISGAINRLSSEVVATVNELDALNRDLERQVIERTADLDNERIELAASLENLRMAQEHLVQSEKMAALGQLVAGVAHEVNTPIGLGLTGSTHFEHVLTQLDQKYRAGQLEEADFERFMTDGLELARSVRVSLERAAELVRSFKQVAVDQSHDSLLEFDLAELAGDVALSHQALLRSAKVELQVDVPAQLRIESYPGAWSQVLSNLISNSLAHGFADGQQVRPVITVSIAKGDGQVTLSYRDNGSGMSAEVARRIFDPFFTTKRGAGGSGLGMHVVYNIVTQKLRGRIALDSSPGEGVCFTLHIPVTKDTTKEPS